MTEESLIQSSGGVDGGTPAADVASDSGNDIPSGESPSSDVNQSVFDQMVPLFKELNYSEDKAREVLNKLAGGSEIDDLTNDEGLVFGKYKDAIAAEEAFKSLESENGRLRREKTPTAPEEYTYDYSEDESMKGVIPEDFDFSQDPLMQALDPVFKEANMTQEQVDAAVKAYLKYEHSSMPDASAEMDKLGGDANAIIQDVQTFVSKNFTPEEQAMIEGMATTAEATKLLHKISKMTSVNKTIPTEASQGSVKSSTELYAEAQKIRQEAGDNFQFNTTAQALYEKKMDAAISAEEKGY